jgi:hypothetical protein
MLKYIVQCVFPYLFHFILQYMFRYILQCKYILQYIFQYIFQCIYSLQILGSTGIYSGQFRLDEKLQDPLAYYVR